MLAASSAIDLRPIFVHTDIVRVHQLVAPGVRGSQLLQAHLSCVQRLADTRPIWMPTYNYGFPTSRRFDIDGDASEVGVLTEYFRTQVADWRTPTPMFNAAGVGSCPVERPPCGAIVDPFGSESLFAKLCELQGSYLFYGAPLSALTIIHHAESLAKVPYRYTKSVSGMLTQGSVTSSVTLEWHVRPRGIDLEYDWVRIERGLVDSGLLQPVWGESVREIGACDARDYLVAHFSRDPLFALLPKSRESVERHLDRLGRPFCLEDFE